MANKQYISIIRLFKHCDITLNEPLQINRIKKQLAAEFDFAPDGFITVDGYSYNKNDVLEELNLPDVAQRLIYHNRMYSSPALLQLLEQNQVDIALLRTEIKTFSNDTIFDDFFSPYFVFPFAYVSRSFINENNLSKLAEWLLFEDFLQFEDREEGFKPIRIYVEEQSRIIKNINEATYHSIRPSIIHLINNNATDEFLNHLPAELYNEKNDLVLYLINLTVRIQKTNIKDCKKISTQLTSVTDIEQQLADLIYNNHQIYSGAATTNSDNKNYWWVVWVIFIVLRIASGC